MHAAGIVKIPFDELPPEMRTKYGYNAQAAAAFRRQSNQAAVERERAIAEAKENSDCSISPVPQRQRPRVHDLRRLLRSHKSQPLESQSSLAAPVHGKSITLGQLFADYGNTKSKPINNSKVRRTRSAER